MRIKLGFLIIVSFFVGHVYASEVKLVDISQNQVDPQLFQYNNDKDIYWKAIRADFRYPDTSRRMQRALSYDGWLDQLNHNKKTRKIAQASAYLASTTCNEELEKFAGPDITYTSTVLSELTLEGPGEKAGPMDSIIPACNSSAIQFVMNAVCFFQGEFNSPQFASNRPVKKSLSKKEEALKAKKRAIKRL